MKPIILIGGGGHCRSVIDVIELAKDYMIEGILDIRENIGKTILGYPIIGTDDDIPKLLSHNISFFVTIGQIKSNASRRKAFNNLKKLGADMPVITSPRAYVSRHCMIGRGTIIHHNAVLGSNSRIGENCIINTGCIVEHDTSIGNHCHISTACIINGQCIIEDDCFIGSNSVLKNTVQVGKGAVIGAGSVVINNIKQDCLAFGNPAKEQP